MADEQEVVNDPGLRARVEAAIARAKSKGDTSKNGKSTKKATRQPRDVTPPADASEGGLDIEAATLAFSPVAFALMSPLTNRLDPEQPYTMEEASLLTRSVLALSEKYPEFNYAEEMAVVLVIGAQLGGRYLAAQMKAAMKSSGDPIPGAFYDRPNGQES